MTASGLGSVRGKGWAGVRVELGGVAASAGVDSKWAGFKRLSVTVSVRPFMSSV